MARVSIAFLCLFFIPCISHAAVVINEVAWMGTAASANDEWIELYNSGSDSVDLSGWTLSGGSLSISLSGNISGNGYFLLERTDDSTVPSVAADQIFTGAISNSGMILQLKNAGGTIIDSLDGTGDWAIGGDNATKDTVQKSGSGWVTAPGTPKAQNANTSSNPPAEQPAQNTSSNSSNTTTGTVTAVDEKHISAEAGPDMSVVAGADAVFNGMAYGFNGSPLANARYVWNFGDGSVAEGKRVLHRFVMPGEYVVMLAVSSGEYSAGDRLAVVASHAQLSIPFADATRIEIQNNSASEVDLGRWYLGADGSTFSIPENTVIPAGKRLILSSEITGINASGDVTLYYPNGEVALTKNTIGEIADAVPVSLPLPVKKAVASVAVSSLKKDTDIQSTTSPALTVAAAAETGSANGLASVLPWFLGALALVGAAAAGIFLTRSPLPEDEFEITE